MQWIAPSEKDTNTSAFEKRLWHAANQFRANSGLKAQEYSAPVPGQLFYSAQTPVCLWFLAKNKNANAKRSFCDRLEVENQLALAA